MTDNNRKHRHGIYRFYAPIYDRFMAPSFAEGHSKMYESLNLKENDHIFVDKGAKHRIINLSKTNLVIIEMWFGNKLDEDDIKRHDDVYGRI